MVMLLFGCKKHDFNVQNLNGNRIGAMGHGGQGIGHVYPLNTFESISTVLHMGADGTEIDLQMTNDFVPVAFHDKYLEGKTDKEGRIFEKSWSEIEDAKYIVAPYTAYQLVNFEQIFGNIDNLHDFIFTLDCKTFNPTEDPAYIDAYTDAIIALIDQFQLVNNVYVSFKRTDMIESMQAKRPDILLMFYTDFEQALQIAIDYNLPAISLDVSEISEADVQLAHDNGIMVAVYNTHTRGRNIDAIEMNVDFIESDMVGYLLRVLDRD